MTVIRTRTRARGELPARGARPVQGVLFTDEDVSQWQLQLTVLGKPAPQGSKIQGAGGWMREDNPRTKPWRATVVKELKERLPEGWLKLDGPLQAEVDFSFTPPRSAGPTDRPCTMSSNDVDKLARTCLDALKIGGAIVDDSRIADLRSRKHYVGNVNSDEAEFTLTEPGVLIKVRRVVSPTG